MRELHSMEPNEEFELDAVSKLTRAEVAAGKLIDREAARSLVDTYYRWQEHRIALGNQANALSEHGAAADRESTPVLAHFHRQALALEKQLVSVLGAWAAGRPEGQWARAQMGIGPVLSAALSAYIDITRAQTAGAIWRYAGLEPSVVWLSREQARQVVDDAGEWPRRGSGRLVVAATADKATETWTVGNETVEGIVRAVAKATNRRPSWVMAAALSDSGTLSYDGLTASLARRPYNPDVKTLCWKIGDSFVKVSGREGAYYGQVYRDRKALEVERNEAGLFADQAASTLETRNVTHPSTLKAYREGMLPAGRIDLRARRYAVKLFLSHWFEVAYEAEYGKPAPNPYPIEHLGHVHRIPVPR